MATHTAHLPLTLFWLLFASVVVHLPTTAAIKLQLISARQSQIHQWARRGLTEHSRAAEAVVGLGSRGWSIRWERRRVACWARVGGIEGSHKRGGEVGLSSPLVLYDTDGSRG